MIIITDHAYNRAKERLKLSRAAFSRLAETAFTDGKKHSEAKGNLKKWITSVYFKNKEMNNIRIYGENCFFFSKNVLVTVYQIPNNLRKYLKL